MINLLTDDLLTLQQVAELFGVGYQTARNWTKRGQLEHRKVGGRIYTTAAAVNRMGEADCQDATQNPSPTNGELPPDRLQLLAMLGEI